MAMRNEWTLLEEQLRLIRLADQRIVSNECVGRVKTFVRGELACRTWE